VKPIRYQIHVYQNASWRLQATFKDPQDTPLDLSGHEGMLVVRQSVAAPEAVLRVDSTSGNVILTADSENNITIRLSVTETDELPTSNREIDDWVYEFLIWETASPEDTTTRLLEGSFRVSPAVAREDDPA